MLAGCEQARERRGEPVDSVRDTTTRRLPLAMHGWILGVEPASKQVLDRGRPRPMGRRRRKRFEPTKGTCGPLDREGRATIAREGAEDLHVVGALPGEEIVYLRVGRRGKHQAALCEEVLEPSPRRVEAPCQHAATCGGCSLQHMALDAQREHKRSVLAEDLAAEGVEPERWLETVAATGEGAGLRYRRRARLGVRWVEKKGRVLVGFREKRDPRFVADSSRCEIMAGGVGTWLPELATLIEGLSIRAKLPQIEVSVGDDRVALVFRVLEAPSAEDRAALQAFGESVGARIDLQTGGYETVAPMQAGEDPHLVYELPTHDLKMRFLPTDFVQVNGEVNAKLIDLVLDELQLAPEHHVLDLFCGLGNFSLPLAKRVAQVDGVEGAESLVARARANAQANGITNVRFTAQNLYAEPERGAWAQGRYDRILVDPPRTGLQDAVGPIGRLGAERLVYVSCSPASLAKDLGVLVRDHGYVLEAVGIADMFSHTAHVESVAVLRKA